MPVYTRAPYHVVYICYFLAVITNAYAITATGSNSLQIKTEPNYWKVLHMALPAIVIVFTLISAQASADCPRGFVNNGTSCYLFSILQTSWIQAMKLCTVHGGELAKVETPAEEEFLEEYLKHTWTRANQTDGIWLGGTDLLVENEWIWAVSQEPVGPYTRWGPGEPNSINRNGEDCMELLPHKAFMWNDENCGSLRNFVCEKSLAEDYVPPVIIG